jgi:hypothetical protein
VIGVKVNLKRISARHPVFYFLLTLPIWIGASLLFVASITQAEIDQKKKPAASTNDATFVDESTTRSKTSPDNPSDEKIWQRRFSGRWSLYSIIATGAKVPVIGIVESRTKIVSLFDLTFDGQRLYGEGKLCGMNVNSGTNLIKTIFPDSFLKSIPRPQLDAQLIYRDKTWHFYQSRQYMVVGAVLKNKQTDRLPNTASDPRVFDQDKDGNPGVTILVDGLVKGSIFVAQRTWTALSGTLRAPGLFMGTVEHGNEQNILDATASYLKYSLELKPAVDRSFFYLTRMSKQATCDQALIAAGFKH